MAEIATADELKALVSPVMIDLRGESEKATLTVANSVANVWNMEKGAFSDPEGLPKDKDAVIVLFCASGGRAQKAKNLLKSQGYTNVHNGGGAKDMKPIFG